ncbi:acyltransferase [Edwardsiella piscicida C07-087]|nr:acyltransferase [Edwardsiella piscicida C07-087]
MIASQRYEMIYSIQYLRGVAALLVVLYHMRGMISFPVGNIPNLGDFLFAQGYFGVDLFFIISGFVIVLSTEKDKSAKSFVIKRIFRIYPLYLFCLCAALLFTQGGYSTSELLRAFLLIQNNYSESAPWFGYSILSVAWTLSYEFLFYAIFFIAMNISHQYRILLSTAAILFFVLVPMCFFSSDFTLSGYYSIPAEYGVWRFITSPMLCEFIAGMLLAALYCNKVMLLLLRPATPIITSVGVSYFILFYIGGVNDGHGVLKAGAAAFMLALSSILIEVFYRPKINKSMSWLGELSYSIYLNQAVIFIIYPYLVYKPGIPLAGEMTIKLSLIIAMSFITHSYIEKPASRFAKKIIHTNIFNTSKWSIRAIHRPMAAIDTPDAQR